MSEIQRAYEKVLRDMFIFCIGGDKLLSAEYGRDNHNEHFFKVAYRGKFSDQQCDAFERALKDKIDQKVWLESKPDMEDGCLIIHLPVDANGELKPYVEKPISNSMAAFDLWGSESISSQTST